MTTEGSRFTRYAFDHARDIILVIDFETGTIVDANVAAEVAYGCTKTELCTLSIFDLRVDPIASVSEQMKTAGTAGILFEAIHRRRDGSTFPVEVNSHMGVVGESRLLFSIIRDISERKRLERERKELLAAAQAALALREEFLAIASHELRTPITAIDLKLQYLLRSLEAQQPLPRIEQAAGDALREVRRLDHLVGALLDARRGEDPVSFEPGDFDLATATADIVERFRMRATQIGSHFVVDVPEIRGRWDRLRVDQILGNLVSNALKFGAGTAVEIAARVEADTVHVEVRDHGIGVAPDDAVRIFERFQRAVPAHYGGFGLGLYITRKAVEAHRGTIRVDSILGHGATFHVVLPLRT